MKTLYIDMDNAIVDFSSAFTKIDFSYMSTHKNNMDEVPGIFGLMDPMPDAIKSVALLSKCFDVYFLSTAPWNNPTAWSDKLLWIKKYFPKIGYKRLILSHHKNLMNGDYLIDDRTANGVINFKGEHIHFGTNGFNHWEMVVNYLIEKEKIKL